MALKSMENGEGTIMDILALERMDVGEGTLITISNSVFSNSASI
jgi:hypothetical protein